MYDHGKVVLKHLRSWLFLAIRASYWYTRANRTSGKEKHHPHTGPGLSAWHCSVEYLARSTLVASKDSVTDHSILFAFHRGSAVVHSEVHSTIPYWCYVLMIIWMDYKIFSSQHRTMYPVSSKPSSFRIYYEWAQPRHVGSHPPPPSTEYARPLRTGPVGLESSYAIIFFPCTTTDNLG